MTQAPTIRSITAVALLGLAVVSRADLLANFDSFVEGQWFDTLTTNGIRFHDVTTHGGGYTNFTIENATSGFLGVGLSSPNVLGFGGYVPGPDMQFGGIGALWFTSDTIATTAGLDIWTFQGEVGLNTLVLAGYQGADVVDTVSFSFDFTPTPTHQRLDLPSNTYDSFRLSSSGPAHLGDACIVIDNVTVAPVPEPASLAILGLGLSALIFRSMRTK